MIRYHINPETGRPNICSANVKCRFGENVSHYDTKDMAKRASIEILAQQHDITMSKQRELGNQSNSQSIISNVDYRKDTDLYDNMPVVIESINITPESSLEDVLSNLTHEQLEAVKAYSEGKSFFEVRSAFENGEPYILPSGKEFLKVADSIFQNTKISERTILHRMMRVDPDWVSRLEPGGEINNNFLASTSRDSSLAKAYGAPKDTSLKHLKLEIEANSGTKVMPGMESLDEIILPPGSRFKINKIEKSYSEEIWDDITTIHCTILEG